MAGRRDESVQRIVFAGIMAALCYVGYAVFPAISVSGTKVHVGNAFVILAALVLGGLYGGLAGAVGLTLADILGGFVPSAPRTFICKLVIGLIVGLFAHKIAHLREPHPHKYVVKWTVIASAAAMLVNCIFEPALKYVWYTLLFPDPNKAADSIRALMAITTVTTMINAVINATIAVLLYLPLRPVFRRLGLMPEEKE